MSELELELALGILTHTNLSCPKAHLAPPPSAQGARQESSGFAPPQHHLRHQLLSPMRQPLLRQKPCSQNEIKRVNRGSRDICVVETNACGREARRLVKTNPSLKLMPSAVISFDLRHLSRALPYHFVKTAQLYGPHCMRTDPSHIFCIYFGL